MLVVSAMLVVVAVVVAPARGHSEAHIHDGPDAALAEDDSHVAAAHARDDPALEMHFHDCAVCRQVVVPALQDAIAASLPDSDAREVVEAALTPLETMHIFDPADRSVKRRDDPSDESDEHVHRFVHTILWDDHLSRSLYALVDVWHHFSPVRRSHFGLLIEHAICVCPHDRLLDVPNVRLHEYLKNLQSALQGAFRKYGGHPDDDPVLANAPHIDEVFRGTDEDLPHQHDHMDEYKHRKEADPVYLHPHDHAPHTDSGMDEHGLHTPRGRAARDEL